MRLDNKGREVHDMIISSAEFAGELNKFCNWYTGVPDSMLNKIIPNLTPYYFAPRENHAISMAFGARLGGRKSCVLMQNSGLGLCIDAIFGLNDLYRVGTLIVLTHRGELKWEEIQHQDWGQKTIKLLDASGIEYFDLQQLGVEAIKLAEKKAFEENITSAIILHRGNIDE